FVHRRGAADIVLEQASQLGPELWIVANLEVGALELLDRLDERLGHVPPAELAEISARVRVAARHDWWCWCHRCSFLRRGSRGSLSGSDRPAPAGKRSCSRGAATGRAAAKSASSRW